MAVGFSGMLIAMTMAVSLWDHALRIAFLFGYALLFAAVEIEIEGDHGWAERLPTWFRVTPLYARAYGLFMRGKPLTGYHLVMFVLPLWSFHLGFVSGVPWTWAGESTALSAYVLWVVIWDFLWFLLNPRFGWGRFRRSEVWWHGGVWIGRFPVDYYSALLVSILLAAAGYAATRTWTVLLNHLILSAGMLTLTAVAAVFAPVYMRWHAHMRRPGSDERGLVLRE